MKIGELFLFGYKPDNFEFIREFARHHGLGGIILFPHNFESLKKLRSQINDLQEICGHRLIVSIDQEGGAVNRITEDFPVFPAPAYYGERSALNGVAHAAATTARNLRSLGINTDFVPVCDVLTNPDNRLMKRRSYSSDPQAVSDFVSTVIKACQANSLLTCAKHFPGLGSAAIDPHKMLATTGIVREEFYHIHFQPFRQAIADSVPLVMTTHLLAAALDPDNMATFSKIIVNDILRSELGFEGVVICDDLGMGAVTSAFTAAERAERVLMSGHDMIMFCHDREDQKSAFEKVLDNINSGKFSEQFIGEKIERIGILKAKIRA